MKTRDITLLCGTILVVGVLGFVTFNRAVEKLDTRLERTRFSDSSPSPQPAVVALSGDKFAVVDQTQISVYRVDAKGKVSRLDDVDTYYKEIRPSGRPSSSPQKSP